MIDIQSIKNRFGIIGNNDKLNHAIEVAVQVAVTDMSVLVIGESGVGKEVFSKIIHQNSQRKHNKYIAVNCGAIPEGTIESELFGHVKGAFTNADRDRKGYFAEADKGTLFLDEVGELPMSMQVKLLRVLESGEFLPVGSSKPLHADVRIVAATNVNLLQAIEKGTFREDLYYRLNQISITIPPLRNRKEDIYLLFRRFAVEQAEKYHMPTVSLTDKAKEYLMNYPWQGNIRQLKNIAEQISIIEKDRDIDVDRLKSYIPPISTLPVIVGETENINDKDKVLMTVFQNKKDIKELKEDVETIKNVLNSIINPQKPLLINPHIDENEKEVEDISEDVNDEKSQEIIEIEDNNQPLTLADMEKNAIVEALKRHNGKRALAAKELGISERTLYRKINDYNLE
ncbi:MAG: sigma 54-interacting transcriptional regulator [Bacteroidales bacterium]|jgi:transcriptional regulator with PAS, ATPase and Fis domain|nr:sigma 54-interacting transcriptional regulator [Bacteroidales bacterium]